MHCSLDQAVQHADGSILNGCASMIELWFKPGMLDHLGLPNIPYPVTIEALDQIIADGGELPLANMLHGLQLRSAKGDADWQGLEPALGRLAELLTPEDDRKLVTAAARKWWVEIGSINLDEPVVTIQRQGWLIAALAERNDGRLRLATFRPLDAKSASYIFDLCLPPYPRDGTVCGRDSNWEYALDCSAGTGKWYAMDRGDAYLSLWGRGIGHMHDGGFDDWWHAMRNLPHRPPANVAMELGVAYASSTD